MLRWSDSLDVGSDVINRQHRLLITLCRRVDDCAKLPAAEARAAYHGILNDLFEVLHQHFSDEEALLARTGYPQLDEHIEEHSRMLEHLAELLCKSGLRHCDYSSLHALIASYLSGHILDWDLAAKPYLQHP